MKFLSHILPFLHLYSRSKQQKGEYLMKAMYHFAVCSGWGMVLVLSLYASVLLG